MLNENELTETQRKLLSKVRKGGIITTHNELAWLVTKDKRNGDKQEKIDLADVVILCGYGYLTERKEYVYNE